MSLVPTVYESTDPGAPQLTGQVGSLTALLDAVLVDGYGVGAERKSGAGWSRVFSAPNVRAYRGSLTTGSGYYLQIDDTASVGNARHGWARGYEAMTSAVAGSNPVPTIAHRANGILLPKSTTLDSVARRWRVIANERFVYLFVDTRGAGSMFCWFAGDCISYKPGDAHVFVVSCVNTSTWTGGYSDNAYLLSWLRYDYAPDPASCSLFIARAHTGAVGAVPCIHFGVMQPGTMFGGVGGGAYPSGINQGLVYEPARFTSAAYAPRGELPGLLAPLQNIAGTDYLLDGQIIEGLNGAVTDRVIAVRTNRACNIDTGTTWRGAVLIRISGSWGE